MLIDAEAQEEEKMKSENKESTIELEEVKNALATDVV